jgi:hypothetical protein
VARPKGHFPSAWTYPHDEEKTRRHRGWSRAKAQAEFRGEVWQIKAHEWMAIWTEELYARRGRAPDELCLIRRDIEKPWHKDNIIMIVRRAHMIIQNRDAELVEIEPGIYDVSLDEYNRWRDRKKRRQQIIACEMRKKNASS